MIFQKMQERKCQKVTDRVLAVIRQQWRQTGEQQAEIGVACNPIGLSGEMILPRLSAQRMVALHRSVKQSLATEGIPLLVTLERDSTVIAWRYAASSMVR